MEKYKSASPSANASSSVITVCAVVGRAKSGAPRGYLLSRVRGEAAFASLRLTDVRAALHYSLAARVFEGCLEGGLEERVHAMSSLVVDFNALHFMRRPSGIAFGVAELRLEPSDEGAIDPRTGTPLLSEAAVYTNTFATCHEHWTGNLTDQPAFQGRVDIHGADRNG